MQRLFLSIVATAILGANFWAVLFEVEDWPLTPAPMFAHYVDSKTPRYRFSFDATFEDGSTKSLAYHSIGANWSLMRFFFKYIYGATPSGGVFAQFEEDSKAAFTERLSKFFQVFSSEYKRRHSKNVDEIELWVELLDSENSPQSRHLVGTFNSIFKLSDVN